MPGPGAQPSKHDAETSHKLTDFFKVRGKAGRRPKAKGAGGRASPSAPETTGLQIQTPRPADVPAKKKKTNVIRIDWSSGESLEKMQAAVALWVSLEPTARPTLKSYAATHGIPAGTLANYVTSTEENRRAVGMRGGAQPLCSQVEQSFVVDCIRRADRANDGKSNQQVIDIVQELKPELSRDQAKYHVKQTLRPNHKKLLSGIVKAQATTTKRTQITVDQQWRWHQLMDSVFNELRDKNTGRCPVSGKSYGELAAHFLLGGDETCLLASDGNCMIIGDKDKKKHEKNNADSRTSATMYRVGNAAGDSGPTGFLAAGKKRAPGYDNAFLVRHGAARGSSLHMTPNGFMTEVAWVELAKEQVVGIRQMPVIGDNPRWRVALVVDGFGAHVSSPDACQIYYDANIILVKEEGDTSHACQAYDQDTAKKDKGIMRSSLDLLRAAAAVSRGCVDQWGLVNIGLGAACNCPREAWIRSFEKVNLNPHTRVAFPEWISRIAHFMQGGQSFKPDEPIDEYALLPSWWHGMEPVEKRKMYDTIETHGGFSVACVRELFSECHIRLPDMQKARCCYELAKMHPEHLTRGAPTSNAVAPEAAVAAAAAALRPVTHGLVSFQLKPDGLIGVALFDHMCGLARRTSPAKLAPSAALNVEITATQQAILNPTQQDLTMRMLMLDAGGDGAKKKLAKRKLDVLGVTVKAHSCIANDPARTKRLKSALSLAASLAEIARVKASERDSKKSESTKALISAAPAAVEKLKNKGGDVTKLTIKELTAIALVHYGKDVPKGADKKTAVAFIMPLIEKNPGALGEALPSKEADSDGEGNASDTES